MQIAVRAVKRWSSIICAMFLATALASCSTNRLAFKHAPTLLYYWLDAYFDFDGPQGVAIKDSLQSLQDWHRQQELPLLADMLKNLQPVATQDVTPEQVCALSSFLQQRVQAPLLQFTPALARLAGSLKPTQLQHMEAEFNKRNQSWRDEWLDLSPAKRLERRSSQLLERIEKFYGKLDEAQRKTLRAQVASSGYDVELQHREMLRRQQDALQTLTRLRNSQLAPAASQAALQDLFARSLVSPDPQARQYSETMTLSLCNGLAALHQTATPAQRARLQATLKDYEADARALMAQAQVQTGQTTP
jgi:hypothetical protein